MARTEHFIGLEWLRFLLAIYVVLFHTVHAYVEDEPTWLSELAGVGFFATSSFFVLSGFLLAHVYCRQGELREPARHFLGKRLANLYPLHLFSLLLTAIVIGFGLFAFALALTIQAYRTFGHLEVDRMRIAEPAEERE